MEMDVDTFLTAVYCVVDDVYRERLAPQKPRGPGRPPRLTDSEVLTLALLEQWRPDRSEAGFVRWVRRHWQPYFPQMLTQSAFNRRVRRLVQVLCRLGPEIDRRLAIVLGRAPAYGVIDGVAVPVMRRCRGEQHRLFGEEAQIGRGGSDRTWFYGCTLLDVVRPEGSISGFVVGPAATQERWLAESLLRWRLDPTAPQPTVEDLRPFLNRRHRDECRGPTGPIRGRLGAGIAVQPYLLGDAGFAGRGWQQHWALAYHTALLTPVDPELAAHPALRHRYRQARQVVETVHSLLIGTFGLCFPRAHTFWGLLARLAAKVAALNMAVLVNALSGHALLSLFDPLQ